MRQLTAFMMLLVLLLAGCATQGAPERWGNSDAAWECHKLQSLGWGKVGSPCGAP